MALVGFEEVLALYARHRHRLPPVPPPVEPRPVRNLSEVVADFDVILLDGWGVLHSGGEALPGTLAAVRALAAAAVPVHVLSNDATAPRRAQLATYRRRGFPFASATIVATEELLGPVLADYPSETVWGVIAPPSWDTAHLGIAWTRLDRGADLDRVDAFLFLATFGWEERDHCRLVAALAARPRPVVVTNPDVAAPCEDGTFSTPPGYFAYRLAEETAVTPRFLGKPYPEVFRHALARHPRVPPERVLMVGDSLHTDVLGARAAGLRALLVTDTGFFRGRDWRRTSRESGIWPDLVTGTLEGGG